MTGAPGVVTAAARLSEALEETAEALAAADLDRLLRGELALQLALEGLTARQAPGGEHRDELRLEVERARRALLRCRHLGHMLLDVVRLGLEAQGRSPAYGPRNARVASGVLRGIDARG